MKSESICIYMRFIAVNFLITTTKRKAATTAKQKIIPILFWSQFQLAVAVVSATHNSTEIKDKKKLNHNRSVKQLIHNTHSDEESKRFTELKTLLNFSSSFLFCTFFNSCSSCHLIISIPKEAKSYRQMFLFFPFHIHNLWAHKQFFFSFGIIFVACLHCCIIL